MAGDWKDRLGMVFSTNPDFEYKKEQDEDKQTLLASQQDLRVWLDRKHRAGKVATIVKGFVGSESDLNDLARVLKTKCGVGGSAKDGEIIVQGDHRDRIVTILTQSGYRCKRAGG